MLLSKDNETMRSCQAHALLLISAIPARACCVFSILVSLYLSSESQDRSEPKPGAGGAVELTDMTVVTADRGTATTHPGVQALQFFTVASSSVCRFQQLSSIPADSKFADLQCTTRNQRTATAEEGARLAKASGKAARKIATTEGRNF